MMSEANLKDLEDAGLRFIVGARIPDVPYQVSQWLRTHPGEPIGDRQVFAQPTIMGTKDDPRRRTIFYQYRADRARRTLKGIDQQIAKAEKAVAAGPSAVKRNRFVQVSGGTRQVNRDLEAKARALAGLKGYVTNLESPTAEYVLGAYHQLWQIENSFRMSKPTWSPRLRSTCSVPTTSCGRSRTASACPRPTYGPGPIYHHTRDSIEANLTIVFAALAVTRRLERRTGWSIKKLITSLRRYHTIQIQASDQIVTAADPLPNDVRAALDQLSDSERRTK